MLVKLHLREIGYCDSVGVSWDSPGQNLQLALKRPSESTTTKFVARQGPLLCMNIHTATQTLCVLQMRNISRFLISLLRFVYPATRKSCSQIQIL